LGSDDVVILQSGQPKLGDTLDSTFTSLANLLHMGLRFVLILGVGNIADRFTSSDLFLSGLDLSRDDLLTTVIQRCVLSCELIDDRLLDKFKGLSIAMYVLFSRSRESPAEIHFRSSHAQSGYL
jgi:hypothetical protein